MGRKSDLVEVGLAGTQALRPSKGAFVLNMFRYNNAWRVRKGFGQIAEFDTEFSYPNTSVTWKGTSEWGYKKVLGTYLLTTSFGHEQLVTVLLADIWVGDAYSAGGENNNAFVSAYLVRVYDITTDSTYEEILYRSTGDQAANSKLMPFQHGFRASNKEEDYKAVIPAIDKEFWFQEWSGILYFGNGRAGLCAYIPSTFASQRENNNIARRRMMIDSFGTKETNKGYEESSCIRTLRASDGPYTTTQNLAYLTQTDFPKPQAATLFLGRMAYAQGRTVYFSDEFYPTSIYNDNNVTIPSKTDVVAMREVNGNLVIFTSDETWIFQTRQNELVLDGSTYQISKNTGCAGPAAIAKFNNSIAWLDANGVYIFDGGFSVKEISKDISSFFKDHVTNPVSHYFDSSTGYTDPLYSQPKSIYRPNLNNVNATYYDKYGMLIFSFPEENLMICMSEEMKWSFWTTETSERTDAGIKAVKNVTNPWIVANNDRLFIVGGMDSETFDYNTIFDATSYSFYVLEYGRGGALDRSMEWEDYRDVLGYWNSAPTSNRYVKFGRPIYMDSGSLFNTVGYVQYSLTNYNYDNRDFMVPVSMKLSSSDSAPTTFEFQIDYDIANYTIKLGSAEGTFLPYFEGNRLWSREGYRPDDPSSTTEMRIYDGVSVDAAGPTLKVKFDGSNASAGLWSTNPKINISSKEEPLFYMIFSHDDTTERLTNPFGVVSAFSGSVEGKELSVCNWIEGGPTSDLTGDTNAQSVDWAYKTDNVGLDEEERLKARGLFLQVKTHGQGDYNVEDTRVFGVLNSAVSSDWRGMSTQLVDIKTANGSTTQALQPVFNKIPLRKRLGTGTNQTTIGNRVFNESASWSDQDDVSETAASGNFLIDETQFDTIATSDTSKGSYFNYLVFGSLGNRAEIFELEKLTAAFRRLYSGARRKGRGQN